MLRAFMIMMTIPPILSWATPGLAQGYGVREGFWHPMSGWGWGHMMFGGIMMLLFWAAIIVLVVLLVRWLTGPHAHGQDAPPKRSSALQILEERFARGEIDKEEFEERRRLLSE